MTADSAGITFETGLYAPGITARTYAHLFAHSRELLEKGRSVILDATLSRAEQRQEALVTARDATATILFVECSAPVNYLQKRLRNRTGKACWSDARLHHLPDFIARYEPFTDMTEPVHVQADTTCAVEVLLGQVLAHHHKLRATQVGMALKD